MNPGAPESTRFFQVFGHRRGGSHRVADLVRRRRHGRRARRTRRRARPIRGRTLTSPAPFRWARNPFSPSFASNADCRARQRVRTSDRPHVTLLSIARPGMRSSSKFATEIAARESPPEDSRLLPQSSFRLADWVSDVVQAVSRDTGGVRHSRAVVAVRRRAPGSHPIRDRLLLTRTPAHRRTSCFIYSASTTRGASRCTLWFDLEDMDAATRRTRRRARQVRGGRDLERHSRTRRVEPITSSTHSSPKDAGTTSARCSQTTSRSKTDDEDSDEKATTAPQSSRSCGRSATWASRT